MISFHPFRFALGALAALALMASSRAQQPAADLPAGAKPALAQAASPLGPPDPKYLQQLETLLNQKFSRDPNEIYQSLEHPGKSGASAPNAAERFLQEFRLGEWSALHREFAAMPPETARKIYNKILADLTERPKPNLHLDDVLALADAAPAELTGDQVHRLGQLFGLAVPMNESYWLGDRLQHGTEKLGGQDPDRRLLTGRILLAGGFKDLARAWLPPLEKVSQIADEGVRNEITSFLSTQQQGDAAQREQIQRLWNENLRLLGDAKTNDWEKQKAAQAMAKTIAQVPPSTLAPVFTDLVKNNPDGAVHLLAGLGRRVQSERNGEIAIRTEDLKAQATLANLLAGLVPAGAAPWSQLFDMMADYWSSEAENTFLQKTAPPNNQPRFVAPEELLSTAPAGAWAAALSPGERDRIDASLAHAILAGANFDAAADRIVEIGKRHPQAGVALAEDFLTAWAKTHNPQIPEPLRRKYELADDARIPVTPMMMEKNIASLARMMDLFRKAGLVPHDYEKVVNAFDLAYSDAEAYRASHIEQVFGPLEQMDEPLFFLIVSRMNGNLADRWRKMDVQRAGLTRRDETQTLEMVRHGYGAALQMIDRWLASHPAGWRGLTLAGTLLTDWGDFEYFQELVSSDPQKRMAGYKEKNLQAQDYFRRGVEAYAREVPRLAPSDYSIDAYLGWFNGLLGIGSGGQINLSKTLNRAALARIREHLLALPEKAAAAHMNLFAKTLNARMTDEKEPLHEDLKYRYLAGALVITKDDPFSFGAEKKVAYYDELLSEIRLQTRVDGPSTIGRDQDFGIVLSIIHTEAMGRVAKFGQYLTNDPGGPAGKARKKTPLARKMRDAQGPRDELELSLTETLSPFFEIKSITFASPDVKARPTPESGWEETVLAYLLVRAKDASVDRIPPVEIDLKFIDLTGPVTIPAESAETVIKMATDSVPPRPFSKVEVTQTLDTRQFTINGALPLEIKATAHGLVPDLEQLVDLDALKKSIEVKSVNPHDGLQVKELDTWGDQVAPTSERLWTIALNGDPIRAADAPSEFHFPPLKIPGATAAYQTYHDMNLAVLPQPAVSIGRSGADGATAPPPSHRLLGWLGAAALFLVVAVGAILVAVRNRQDGEETAGARDVFQMPQEVDGFAVIALLRRLRASPLVPLREAQREELQGDLQRVQQACFGAGQGGMPEADLRGIAEKWLRLAT